MISHPSHKFQPSSFYAGKSKSILSSTRSTMMVHESGRTYPRRQLVNPIHRSQKYLKTLEKFSSEPILINCSIKDHTLGYDHEVLRRNRTCTDMFSSFSSASSASFKSYLEDVKVVMNVTIEGSPGPLRLMIKLGSTVDETIKLILKKYCEEGRTPKLEKCLMSDYYELHQSQFCLQSLDKSERIGDVSSRSFYLRRRRSIDAPTISPPPSNLMSSVVDIFYKVVKRIQKSLAFLICMR